VTIQRPLSDAELSQVSKSDQLSNDMFHFSLQQRTLVNTGESMPHDSTTISNATVEKFQPNPAPDATGPKQPKGDNPAMAQPGRESFKPPGAKLENHEDSEGSTAHHGKGFQGDTPEAKQNRIDHGPGGKSRTGTDAGQDNSKYGVREPMWHGDRSPRFKNVEDDDPDFQSISGDQMGRNEAEDTQGKPNFGADWKTKNWGTSGGGLPLHGHGRRPSLSEPGYHQAKKDPLASRQTQAHPIFDRALVAKAIRQVLAESV